MNKAQLIDALAERLGDRKVAAAAVAGLIDVVVRTVNADDRVTITGFGVFEKRARAARTARNPRTGQSVTVQQTHVPVFRPGTLFREVVSGTRTLPALGASGSAVTAHPVAASPSQPATSPSPRVNANSRPATRVTAATRLTAVQAPPAKAPKAAKRAKVTDSVQEPKSAKAAKAAKPATNGRNGESKTVAKAPTKTPTRIDAKKAAKKSVVKKSVVKKSAGKKSAAK